jgi:copper chaperone CopZ
VKTTLSIEGMTCQACVARVREALEEVEGVSAADVDLSAGSATVTHDEDADAARLIEAVDRMEKYAARLASEHDGQRGVNDDEGSSGGEASESLYPLILVAAFLAGTVLLVEVASGGWRWTTMTRHFMAGFFLVFSFFKLLDLRGFVDAYRSYDLLARLSPAWGWVYPFVELGLGVCYLLDVAPVPVNATTVVLMLVGAVGVFRALLDERQIMCGCLGTALNLPMTTVTLVEDLTMAAMAGVMLWVHLA